MKLRLAALALLLSFSICHVRLYAQAINVNDSLALVDLYNNTGGANWINHTNWLTTSPVSTWFGVSLDQSDASRVGGITLPSNNLLGTIPASLGNLTNSFIEIDLQYNRLSGSLPASLVSLNYALVLLSHNQLAGPLPNYSASNISSLDISYNNFTFADLEPFDLSTNNGPTHRSAKINPQADIPLIFNNNIISISVGGTQADNTYTWYKDGAIVSTKTGDSTYTTTSAGAYAVVVSNVNVPSIALYSIQNLNSQDSLALIDLYNGTNGTNWINNTGWSTSAPAASWAGVQARFGRVVQLNLTTNNLSGTVPSSIGNLTSASTIDFSTNKLTGSLPSSLGSLQSLTILNIDSNQITGNIPSTVGNLSNITYLDLARNQLTGNIPAELGNLTSLQTLYLFENQISGAMPPQLGNLVNVTTIDFSNNQLSDTIPAGIGNCSSLSEISLNNNQLTGAIPSSIERLKSLQHIILSYNKLSGSIPDSICFLPSLLDIYVDNNALTGSLPDSLANDTQVRQIHAQNNNLTGKVNTKLSSLSLSVLYLYGNKYNFSAFPLNLSIVPFYDSVYPQQNIPLSRLQSTLSVSAGGNSANSTFTLFKDGVSIGTQIGDSAFPIQSLGNYNIVTTNTDVPGLTLYSDTLKLGLVLPDSTVGTTQTITGTTPTDIDAAIFRLVTITPNTLSGDVTALETVDTSIQTFNGAPYARRHYDITPTNNPSTASATITLYFSQADFDAYNKYVTDSNLNLPLLPTSGTNNGNVIITQYHGAFTGTSSPANYGQGPQVIVPSVAWDAINSWWTVTFPVSGFSGFFLGTSSTPLPLTLLQFSGTPQDYSVNLAWATTQEKNTKQFIVRRSSDSSAFEPIGTVAAKNEIGEYQYNFTDTHPFSGNNFYQLEMQDMDGQFTYSPIVKVTIPTILQDCEAYPDPAIGSTSLVFHSTQASPYSIQITDLAGRTVYRLESTSAIGLNKVDIDVQAFTPGVYMITLTDKEHGRRTIQLIKK